MLKNLDRNKKVCTFESPFQKCMKEVRVIELFAGVGGFRVGLDRADADFFKTIWANQWEPATKVQHAAMVYEKNFGAGSVVNDDINLVKTEDIPDHDMLGRASFGGPYTASSKKRARDVLQ